MRTTLSWVLSASNRPRYCGNPKVRKNSCRFRSTNLRNGSLIPPQRHARLAANLRPECVGEPIVAQRRATWFLRKATASSLEHQSVCDVLTLRCRVLACHAVDTAFLAMWFLFGKLFGVAALFDFGEKRCRKNLPLCEPSYFECPCWQLVSPSSLCSLSALNCSRVAQ